MKNPQRFAERALHAIGVRFVFLNQHASAAIDQNSPESLVVRYHAPEDGSATSIQLPAALGGDEYEAQRREKTNAAGAQFTHGMRTLAQRMRKENRLSRIATVTPDARYPNPYFAAPLSAREFFERFGSPEEKEES